MPSQIATLAETHPLWQGGTDFIVSQARATQPAFSPTRYCSGDEVSTTSRGGSASELPQILDALARIAQ
jgi:hypothetical protein